MYMYIYIIYISVYIYKYAHVDIKNIAFAPWGAGEKKNE